MNSTSMQSITAVKQLTQSNSLHSNLESRMIRRNSFSSDHLDTEKSSSKQKKQDSLSFSHDGEGSAYFMFASMIRVDD